MEIFCWPSDLRIKTKADVLRFMDKTSGEMYFTDGVNDYRFEKRPKGEGEISYRSVTEREIFLVRISVLAEMGREDYLEEQKSY